MSTSAGPRSRQIRSSIAVGLVAVLISLGRIWWRNPESVTQVLWAEDGLFPLCVSKAGFFNCLFDPFAGYSVFLPRVLAGVTASFPVEWWALAANVMAALLAGIDCGSTWWWMRRYGLARVTSMVIALLLVVVPIVGLEAINVLGSTYMLLLFVAAVALAFPLHPYPVKTVSVLLLVTALTIPSAAVLLIVLVFQVAVGAIRRRSSFWLFAGLLIGLVVQATVALTSDVPRPVNPGWDALRTWVDLVPTAVLSFWPGLNLGEVTVFTNYVSSPSVLTGWVLVLVLAFWGLWLVTRRTGRLRGAGLIVLIGLSVGAMPSIIGFTNNRYFVVPCVLWACALIVVLDDRIRDARPWVLVVIGVAVLVIWWPALPASAWRTTPAPAWRMEVARVAAHCKTDPSLTERPVFTPFWPPNWGDGLREPSHPSLPCLIGWNW